jgi:hypothetical protein
MPQKQELESLHKDFGYQVKLTSCHTAAASFLMIGALIVITCGSLCLMLPGINVVSHVILPAVIPGSLAILTSIPFILAAIKHAQDKQYIRKLMLDRMRSHLDVYKVPEQPRKARIHFILIEFLNWKPSPHDPKKLLRNRNWTKDYQGKILTELKEKIGKNKADRNPRQEKIATALDKALIKVNAKQRRKKNTN